jgi:glycosyltransferase involved in cell wall biosynthesis
MWLRLRGDRFKAADAALAYRRMLSTRTPGAPPAWIRRVEAVILQGCTSRQGNDLLRSYLGSREAEGYRKEFWSYGVAHVTSLKYPRAEDRPEREGDLVLLKPSSGPDEKGVLLVEYNDGLRKFASLYDLHRLAAHYRFVLEPGWWGYQRACILMFLGLPTDVIVEAQYQPDHRYVSGLGHNLHAIDLGFGDWVDPDTFSFSPTVAKIYDVVMIANWLRLKRHERLFEALSRIRHHVSRVALVGYPAGSRTLADVRAEAERHGVWDMLDVHEQVPPEKVSEVLQQSKVCVMLTRREGANRAIYESFFSNTPVIVSNANVGVNRRHVNDCTGVFASDDELSDSISFMVKNYARYHPRAWATANTGYKNSTHRLNQCLKALATAQGERWSQDIYYRKNTPNAMYAYDHERLAAREALPELGRFLR